MFSRRDLPRHRHCSDPWSWNRSVNGQALEDYWEDASVSMIPAEWWERDSTHSFSSMNGADVERSAEIKTLNDGGEGFPGISKERKKESKETQILDSAQNEGIHNKEALHHIQMPSSIDSSKRETSYSMGDSHSYPFLDGNPPASALQIPVIDAFRVNSCVGSLWEETSFLRARCSFPPPIVSCATLSFKERGRFVLKEANIRPHRFFHAERENGRLRLQLIEPLGDEAKETSQKESHTEDGQVESQDEFGLNSVISVAGNETESCVLKREDPVKTLRIFDFSNEDDDDDDDDDVVNGSGKAFDNTSYELDDQVFPTTTVCQRSQTDCCFSQWNDSYCELQQGCANDAGTSSAMQLSFVLTADEKETMERGGMQFAVRSEDGGTNGQPAQNAGDETGGDGDNASIWVSPSQACMCPPLTGMNHVVAGLAMS